MTEIGKVLISNAHSKKSKDKIDIQRFISM